MHETAIIFFDVGNTLLYPDPHVGRAYYDCGTRHGVETPSADAVHKSFMRAWKVLNATPSHITDPAEARQWWRTQVFMTFEPFGNFSETLLDALFEELYEYFTHAKAWRLFDDVSATLETLRKSNIRIGILSNWDSRLRTTLDEFGILDMFDPVIISFETGFEKPDREIYLLACHGANIEPHKCLMVGDSIADDFDGVITAGFKAVHLARNGHSLRTPNIKSLREIPALIGLS